MSVLRLWGFEIEHPDDGTHPWSYMLFCSTAGPDGETTPLPNRRWCVCGESEWLSDEQAQAASDMLQTIRELEATQN